MPASKLSIPSHIGIIMDGNGRWAEKKNLPRTAGHKEGLQAAKRIVKAASELGVFFLTLYVFSTENWKRAENEVSFLMKLIQIHLKKEYNFYRKNHIRVLHLGDLLRLPDEVKKEIASVTRDTAGYDGLTVNLAINYGGRDEIIRAVNRHLDSLKEKDNGTAPINDLTLSEKDVANNLDLPELPEADLIIRTGGEIRLSNFLLWESVYAELYFSKKLWPDWDKEDLLAALEEYSRRERRFGAVK